MCEVDCLLITLGIEAQIISAKGSKVKLMTSLFFIGITLLMFSDSTKVSCNPELDITQLQLVLIIKIKTSLSDIIAVMIHASPENILQTRCC